MKRRPLPRIGSPMVLIDAESAFWAATASNIGSCIMENWRRSWIFSVAMMTVQQKGRHTVETKDVVTQ